MPGTLCGPVQVAGDPSSKVLVELDEFFIRNKHGKRKQRETVVTTFDRIRPIPVIASF